MSLPKKILVLGATGFIGQDIALRLGEAGHQVTGLGRNIGRSARKLPAIRWIGRDLARIKDMKDWLPLLDGVDAVVNCAGALQDGLHDDLLAVQQKAMLALYAASALKPEPPVIVQISAPADLSRAGTSFIETKLAADRALAQSGLAHVILRPTLVIGRNAHGGTALLRALASLPGVIVLVEAETPVAAVHMDDVTGAVLDAIEGKIAGGSDLVLAGGPVRTLEEVILAHRAWLGLPPPRIIRLRGALGLPATAIADLAGTLGWRSPLRSTAMAVSRLGIHSTGAEASSIDPLAALAKTPSGVQDLWFARLYLLKPLMILCLAAFWTVSGLVPLADPFRAAAGFGNAVSPVMALFLTFATCLLDIAIGLSVLYQPLARKALISMIAISCAYLAGGTLFQPGLWLDPLGPLVKIFPSMALTLATLAILPER
jgi:uncharacterized protein YbjT (DUF2867 family)